MLTEQLFEQWNFDHEMIVGKVHAVLGPCDIFIGGSLADDLGTSGSDVDLYCFLEDAPVDVRRPLVTECGDASLELHVVEVAAAIGQTESLASLVVDAADLPPHQWPLLSPQELRRLHALYRDRGIYRAVGAAESFRRAAAPDLLHLYVALRALLTCVSLAEDVGALVASEERWSALYCSRLAVESALDAALASRGMVNPNSKWRVPLAQRVQLVDPQFPDLETLLGGLFPDPRAPGEAVRRCLDTAAHCLRVVTDDGFLASFPIVAEAVELLDAAVPGPDGDG